MWQYHQKTGQIYRNGVLQGFGYSGHDAGKNKPEAEALRAVGPIPRGKWLIEKWLDKHPSKGPIVAVLKPVGHDAHGRSGFLIHGDSIATPGAASLGCIILSRHLRELMMESGDKELEVTE